MTSRRLDFIIIGAQKGGTTSLWQYLRHHPAITMPALKEAPFFSTEWARKPGALNTFIGNQFADPSDGALLGKATPDYMKGAEGADVEEIARRIAARLPSIKLIALLRDPIDRAVSHYRMSLRRGYEQRSLDQAAQVLLAESRLVEGRRMATETNSYFAQGEYGRVLRTYRSYFSAEQLHVEQTSDMERDPAGTLDRVLGFLGLEGGFRPGNLAIRYHRGGATRIDAEREAWLFEFLGENVWPLLGSDAARITQMFGHFYEVWSTQPDDHRPPISAPTRARLEEHYRADAELLAELGVAAPWIDDWDHRQSAGSTAL
jgi:hypothetical protein